MKPFIIGCVAEETVDLFEGKDLYHYILSVLTLRRINKACYREGEFMKSPCHKSEA